MGAWLHAIGLGAHATAFEAHNIDGAALVLLSREERLSARTLSRTRTRIRTPSLSLTRSRTLSLTIRKANLDGRDRQRMDATLSELCDDVGACERIFKTPIPLVYTRHTSRFVGFWLALLPLAVYGVDTSWNHLLTIPSCMVITFFLLGIEELGLQIEEPFSILPIEAFCDASIGAVLNDMVLAADKDRGVDKLFFSRYDTTGDGDTDALNHHRNPNPISSANLEP